MTHRRPHLPLLGAAWRAELPPSLAARVDSLPGACFAAAELSPPDLEVGQIVAGLDLTHLTDAQRLAVEHAGQDAGCGLRYHHDQELARVTYVWAVSLGADAHSERQRRQLAELADALISAQAAEATVTRRVEQLEQELRGTRRAQAAAARRRRNAETAHRSALGRLARAQQIGGAS